MITPKDIQLVGEEIAILWNDGKETYFTAPYLRANSPSAEAQGEKDIFGTRYGGESKCRDFRDVRFESWEQIGNYAIRFEFSDKHRTGLYSYELLRRLASEAETPNSAE